MTLRCKNKPPGSNWGEFGPDDQRRRSAPRVRAMMAQLIDWTQQGHLKPTLSGVFDLDRYAEAMDSILSRRSIGKVALRIGA